VPTPPAHEQKKTMAKNKEKEVEEVASLEEVIQEAAEAPMTPREARWKQYVANYKLSNPVKGAAKEARGEFKEVPLSFQ